MEYNKLGMFSTKRYHKWGGTHFLNNHKDKNVYRDPGSRLPNRWKHRQMQTASPKTGHNSYFRNLRYASDPYPGTKSREAIENSRIFNGFGISSHRGNYSTVVAQNMWKQRIDKERNSIRRVRSKGLTLEVRGISATKPRQNKLSHSSSHKALTAANDKRRPQTAMSKKRLYDIYHDMYHQPKHYVCISHMFAF